MSTPAAYSIIAAEFNKPLIDAMVAVAREELAKHGLPLGRIVYVPGCYEVPLVASGELARPAVGGLVVLGYIERGETLHGEVMGHVVHRCLVELQLAAGKPIGLGIIGPGATQEQAKLRYANSARAAVLAVKRVAELLTSSS